MVGFEESWHTRVDSACISSEWISSDNVYKCKKSCDDKQLYSDVFKVQEGIHQGSVLSSLPFVVVLEASSWEFETGCPWELLYADDLVITAGTMDELLYKLDLWKKTSGNQRP